MPGKKRIDQIRKNIAMVSEDHTVLDMLMEFEKTLDKLDMFAFKNWIYGELVDGPHISKYWFNTTWMYRKDKMPDPTAGMRLVKLGCKVYFEKGFYEEPQSIKGFGSYSDPATKEAKLDQHDVWFVIIEMPRKFIDEGLEELVRATDLEMGYKEFQHDPEREETGDDVELDGGGEDEF